MNRKIVFLTMFILGFATLNTSVYALEITELKNDCVLEIEDWKEECELEIEFEDLTVDEMQILEYAKQDYTDYMNVKIGNIDFTEFSEFAPNKIRIKGTIAVGSHNYFGIHGLWNSTWFNSSLKRMTPIPIMNNLDCDRTNLTAVFNISRNFTLDSCVDITFSKDNVTEFTNYNVTPKTTDCEIRLFDNLTALQNQTYYAYYNCSTCDFSANWKTTPYELTWLWNEADGTQFNTTEVDTGTCTLNKITVGSTNVLQIDKDSCNLCYANITDWSTQNCGNIGDDVILGATANYSAGSWNSGILNLFLEMGADSQNFYNAYHYDNNVVNLFSLRKRTAGSYGGADVDLAMHIDFDSGELVTVTLNRSENNICIHYIDDDLSGCNAYAGSLTGNVAGIGAYGIPPSDHYFRDMFGGTYMTNRNLTILFGDEMEYPEGPAPADIIIDESIICFRTQPICVKSNDLSIIYKGDKYV